MLELEHGQTLQLHSDFVVVLVKKGEHVVFGGIVAVDGALGGHAGGTGTEDDNVLPPLGRVHRLQIVKFEGETVKH